MNDTYLIAKNETLGINVFATTRAKLKEEIAEQLEINWREYALEEDSLLSKDAKQLKKELLLIVKQE